jgi:toxin ParE1/3/4
MAYSVRFLPAAAHDLMGLHDYIAPSAGEAMARDFVARLHGYCLGLDTFPERGTLRNDIRPNMRLLGYRRKATIAFTVHDDTVFILRIFGRGQDVEGELEG